MLLRLFTIGAVPGTTFTLLVSGILLGIDSLKWDWPAALFLLAIALRFAPRWRDNLAMPELCLEQYRDSTPSDVRK